MSKTLLAGLAGAALATLVTALCGCARFGTTRSILTIGINGREVKAIIDQPAGISSTGDNAVVDFGGHKLVVEKERIVLDGKEQAKLPAGAKTVELEYTGGKLTAGADGASLAIAGQPK